MGVWHKHLEEHKINNHITQLFDQDKLEFDDVHSLELALVEGQEEKTDKDIIGFHGAVLLSSRPEETSKLLTEEMGLSTIQSNDRNFHFETVGEERHHLITEIPPRPRGRIHIGTVHHIACTVRRLTSLLEWREKLENVGLRLTDVR